MAALALVQFFAPARAQDNVSPGGSVIYRYDEPKKFEQAEHAGRYYDAITAHLESFLGEEYFVLHEIVSDKIHLDVLVFPPVDQRDNWVLVTAGMSDLAMSVPEGIENPEDYRYAEIVATLPADWFELEGENQIPDAQLRDETRYWPIRQVKSLGRLPHDHESWLYYWHSVPNGDPAKPFADNTGFTGVVMLPPISWPEGKFSLAAKDGNEISFLAVYPVYDEEMEIKLQYGSDTLIDLFAATGVTDLIDISRANVSDLLKKGESGQ